MSAADRAFEFFDGLGDVLGEPSGLDQSRGAEDMLFDMMNSPERDAVFYDHQDRTAMIAGSMLAELAEVYEHNGMSEACYKRMVQQVHDATTDQTEAMEYWTPPNITLGEQ